MFFVSKVKSFGNRLIAGIVALVFLAVSGWVSSSGWLVVVCLILCFAVFLFFCVQEFTALSDRVAKISSAFTSTGQGWLLIDATGHEILRSPLAEKFFADSSDPLASFLDLGNGDDDGLQRLKEAAYSGVAHQVEISTLSQDGLREWFRLAVQKLPSGDILWSVEDVSGQHAINDVLRRDYESLSDFLDYLPVGFYSADMDGRIRFANYRLGEWLGTSPDRLVGRSLQDFFGTIPDPEGERSEVSFIGRNSEEFHAVIVHAVFDEGGESRTCSILIRDLIPEQSWERSFRMAEQRSNLLFENSPAGILQIEQGGAINLCNPAFAVMVGLPVSEIIGADALDFILDEDRPIVGEHFSRILTSQGNGVHLPVHMKGDGRELVASLHISPIRNEENISGLICHLIDTTEHKHLEMQFAQSQKMQAMGQLAGGIAHDFNNLLTAMIGFCDLLMNRHSPGDATFADVMQIKQNANRAASLVRQLLAFSRRQALQPRLFDVTDALVDLSNLLRRLLGERIELSISHGRDLGLVRVDPGQFDQVIINLAVNARDAMMAGGKLTISTRLEQVQRPIQRGADLMPPGQYVLVTVADSGTGIAPENIGRIFEPFFSTKEVGAGTGLGLSTVYGIVRQTGGFIFVESELGQGTSFFIWLPRMESETISQTQHDEVAIPLPGNDLTGKGKILLVEDEDAVRLFGSRALRNQGYQVIEACSGEHALDVLRTEEGIDLLVTDVVMPGIDGTTLAKLVRMERPAIKVILMSGYAEDTALGEFTGEGGIHFLPKPFSLKQLAAKVKEVLGK